MDHHGKGSRGHRKSSTRSGLRKWNDIIIFDVTVPFENGLEALDEARRLKNEKYKNLADELSENGKRAVVEAIVIGVLSSWDPANDKSLRRMDLCQILSEDHEKYNHQRDNIFFK